MKKNNKILSQGNYDGHCLHYAIMNAFKALSEPDSTAYSFAFKSKTKWQKIIALTPSLQNFSSGYGSEFGINTLNAANKILENLMCSYFEAISEKTKSFYRVQKLTIDDIDQFNYKDSVLIFCLKDKAETKHYSNVDHWICCVGQDNKSLHLACSHVLFEIDNNYAEHSSISSGSRFYNNSIEFSQIQDRTIYKDQIYQITKNML